MTNITLNALVAALISTSATQSYASGGLVDLDGQTNAAVAAVDVPAAAQLANEGMDVAAADMALVNAALPVLALSDAADAATQTESRASTPALEASLVEVAETNAPPSSPAILSATSVAGEGDAAVDGNAISTASSSSSSSEGNALEAIAEVHSSDEASPVAVATDADASAVVAAAELE